MNKLQLQQDNHSLSRPAWLSDNLNSYKNKYTHNKQRKPIILYNYYENRRGLE